jgi:hypothetical protein
LTIEIHGKQYEDLSLYSSYNRLTVELKQMDKYIRLPVIVLGNNHLLNRIQLLVLLQGINGEEIEIDKTKEIQLQIINYATGGDVNW